MHKKERINVTTLAKGFGGNGRWRKQILAYGVVKKHHDQEQGGGVGVEIPPSGQQKKTNELLSIGHFTTANSYGNYTLKSKEERARKRETEVRAERRPFSSVLPQNPHGEHRGNGNLVSKRERNRDASKDGKKKSSTKGVGPLHGRANQTCVQGPTGR